MKRKPVKMENPEKIKEFLETPEGRKFFKEITTDFSSANRYDLKKNLTGPKPGTRKRLSVRDQLISKINELNVK